MAEPIVFQPVYYFPYANRPKWDTKLTVLESLSEKRRCSRSAPRREFTLTWGNMTSTDADYIEDFFIARKGAYQTFNFYDPDELAIATIEDPALPYTVRFGEDTLNLQRLGKNQYSGGCTLVQVGTSSHSYSPTPPFAPEMYFPFANNPEFDTRKTSQSGGVELRSYRTATARRVFDLTFGTMTAADAVYIRSFFEWARGMFASFAFTDPTDSASYTVRFDSDELNMQKTGKYRYGGSCRLVEVAA